MRAVAQVNGIDIFGANCLGVADAWNHIRIGGALGGDKPEESLRKGSVAIYSNSGNFTTTIAGYLAAGGWGTTTSVSSGKDLYIHFAPAEFAYALDNDLRSKAAVMYIEPGGYYEQSLEVKKPLIACVVGRWKSKLTRAVGHAGAMAGGGDSAETKEQWFQDIVRVDGIFTPERPVCSKHGAVVTNIAHIPAALTAVMKLNGVKPDFAPEGDLTLKPWFGDNQGLPLPPELDIPLMVSQNTARFDTAADMSMSLTLLSTGCGESGRPERQAGRILRIRNPPRSCEAFASRASKPDWQKRLTSIRALRREVNLPPAPPRGRRRRTAHTRPGACPRRQGSSPRGRRRSSRSACRARRRRRSSWRRRRPWRWTRR
jgi:hypothetical protein